MSKSIGNILPAKTAMNDMGADVLRLWVAATDYRGELTVGDEVFKRTSDSYRRIRNTARFLLSNLDGFDPGADALPAAELLSLDRWAIDRALGLQQELIAAFDGYEFHVIYQKLHHFCSIDLGGFYLDIIKDRQYTTAASSKSRRSAQTAMYHIAEALVRWMAPILSFTAEEIWENMPGERSESVFLEQWYTGLSALPSDAVMGREYWQTVMLVRTALNKEMETQRAAGLLRGSLDAEVTLYCDGDLLQALEVLSDELRFVLITSAATLAPLSESGDAAVTEIEGLRLTVSVSGAEKCERCWHRRPEVGQIEVHPTLCERCVSNIDGEGEQRNYA
jgi:isoleucyl-tRNA synthetase